jgi:ketosteroid isomerase-like protein
MNAATVFASVDQLDPDAVTALLAEDATMVFGNNEPLVGRPAILASHHAFFAQIKGCGTSSVASGRSGTRPSRRPT